VNVPVIVDMASSATIIIKQSTDVVWPCLLDQAAWMTEFKIETVGGERNREGEVKKVTSLEPSSEYHPFFFKTLTLIPLRRFVYKAYTESRGGRYGFTGVEVLTLLDLGKDSAVAFEAYLELESWTMTRDQLADFVSLIKEGSRAMWGRNFERLAALVGASRLV
jgi:hypothetical protein